MLLLFFIFAVIGVQLFGGLRYGFSINQDNNYRTWSAAMVALWRGCLGNWRSNMYDAMVQPPFCTTDYVQKDIHGKEFQVNDCGSPFSSILYHCTFQIFSTFAVLNVVIAIILGAFTWCYSMEESELTSELPVTANDLRHFRKIWDRFDLFSTGQIDVNDLQLFLAIVQYHIPNLFSTGLRTQEDKLMFKDYSSFNKDDVDKETGELKDGATADEIQCYQNYKDLVAKIGDYDRSEELWEQLELAGCDVLTGCNDNVAGFDIKLHPLGSSDANLHIFTKEIKNDSIEVPMYTPRPGGGGGVHVKVVKVKFMSIINILVIDPLTLSDHDVYVCFKYKDPFSSFMPGYFGDKYPVNGKVKLNINPQSIAADGLAMPYEKPAFFRSEKETDKTITEEELAGMYTLDELPEEIGDLISEEEDLSHNHNGTDHNSSMKKIDRQFGRTRPGDHLINYSRGHT